MGRLAVTRYDIDTQYADGRLRGSFFIMLLNMQTVELLLEAAPDEPVQYELKGVAQTPAEIMKPDWFRRLPQLVWRPGDPQNPRHLTNRANTARDIVLHVLSIEE